MPYVLQVSTLSGGDKRNAIARDALATVLLPLGSVVGDTGRVRSDSELCANVLMHPCRHVPTPLIR